jgi:hypothetical protein
MRISARFCWAALAFAVALTAVENPFAGTWKLNAAKSKFTGTITKYEQEPSGVFVMSSGGTEYEFKIDGRDYPAPFGYTAVWKQVSPSTWETVAKLKGKPIPTDRIELSPDGRKMTVTSTGQKPAGESFKTIAVLERVAGGPGLAGSWKSAKVQITSPDTMEIAATGPDGFVLSFPAWKATCKARFDGKDYPVTGPTVSAGFTTSFKATGPRVLQTADKHNGKLVSLGSMKVLVLST